METSVESESSRCKAKHQLQQEFFQENVDAPEESQLGKMYHGNNPVQQHSHIQNQYDSDVEYIDTIHEDKIIYVEELNDQHDADDLVQEGDHQNKKRQRESVDEAKKNREDMINQLQDELVIIQLRRKIHLEKKLLKAELASRL